MNNCIVIVDDETHIRILLEETLEELEDDGIEIYLASNGEQALEVIRRQQPKLVFLDVMMPILNGYDVCEQVRADPALAGIEIIMLTAKGQDQDRQRGIAAGANDYITKPFDPDVILARARSVFGLTE
ncbi:MAG: response regulator [Gallionella sp.]|jgi:DNA-binding response OmpR family regulator